MVNPSNFCNESNPRDFRVRYLKRKLEILFSIRDKVERRLSALNASIDTLNTQISKYESEN